eukprot:357655-Chlamydomonas_euryale.AAC.2
MATIKCRARRICPQPGGSEGGASACSQPDLQAQARLPPRGQRFIMSAAVTAVIMQADGRNRRMNISTQLDPVSHDGQQQPLPQPIGAGDNSYCWLVNCQPWQDAPEPLFVDQPSCLALFRASYTQAKRRRGYAILPLQCSHEPPDPSSVSGADRK